MGGADVQGASLSLLGPFLATFIAGALILVLPGSLIVLLAAPRLSVTLAERLTFGVAASWALLTATAIIAFAAGASTTDATLALLVITAVLGAMWLRQRAPVSIAPDLAHLAILAGIVLVAFMSYRVGGYANAATGPAVGFGWSAMEELLQLSTVRKVLELPQLRFDAVMYAKGEFVTYVVPVYPFVLAVLSLVSGLDPLIIFDTARFWWAAISLLAFYSIAAGALGSTPATWATLIALGLVTTGHAAQMPGFGGWGQLVPVSHLGDFGLGVLFPLALALLVRVAAEPRESRFYLALCASFLAAVILTHTREAAHIASYLAAMLLVGSLLRSMSLHQGLRLAALLAALIVVAGIYGAFVTANVPFIGEHEAALLARSRVEAYLGPSVPSLRAPDVPYVLQPFVAIGYLLTPLYLAYFRRSPGVIMIVSGLMLWWLPLHSPLAGLLLQRITYSEIMMSPGRYIFHAAYLLYAMAVYLALRCVTRTEAIFELEHRPRTVAAGAGRVVTLLLMPAWWLVAVVTLLIIGLPWLMPARLATQPLWVVLAGAVLAWVGIRTGVRGAGASDLGPPEAASRISRAVLVVAVALGVMWVQRPGDSLWALAANRPLPQTANLHDWYESSSLNDTLPWEVVQMLKTAIPPGSVIASDPALGLAVPSATSHYVLASGTNFTTDLNYLEIVSRHLQAPLGPDPAVDRAAFRHLDTDALPAAIQADIVTWRQYHSRLQRLVEMVTKDRRPLFSESEDSATTVLLLNDLAPQYLLLSTERHPRLARLARERAPAFTLVGAAGEMQLYRVTYPLEVR